jgi:LPXTG-motif cell wall-anchored protein
MFSRTDNTPHWSYQTSAPVQSVAISSDGNYIVVGDYDGKVYFFNREIFSGTTQTGADKASPTETLGVDNQLWFIISGVVIVSVIGLVFVLRRRQSKPKWYPTKAEGKDETISF